MVSPTPEQLARDEIDKMLVSAGWRSQKKVDLPANKGVVVREYQTALTMFCL